MTRDVARDRVVRIANAQAFWGDDDQAAARLLSQDPQVDYITLDYLAEVSMSIMARQRERNPSAGFARDFVGVVASLARYWKAGGECRVVTNAGGLDPRSCALACAEAMKSQGVTGKKIGVVTGDDVLSLLGDDSMRGWIGPQDRQSFEGLKDRLVTANAYLGAEGIVEALKLGADIVVTGRTADPSLVVGPAAFEMGWACSDYNRLAGATVAGHLIECGTQVTGGICTDWLSLGDQANIGFPIVEIAADGSCTMTKPPSSGGIVNEQTVKEQLLYELGDPGCYLSPDCTVSFLTLNVEDLGNSRVRVSGATGHEPPPGYKVSATYRAGYRASGTLTILGSNAKEKARRCGRIVEEKMKAAGMSPGRFLAEPIGGEDQVTLRLGVADERREVCEFFSRLIVPLVTSGPQGTTGYFDGRPKVREVFGYLPLTIARAAVGPRVEVVTV